MVISTSLLGQEDLAEAKWWYFLDHGLKIFIPLAGCWLVHGYFLTTHFKRISGFSKQIVSIVIGIFILLILGYILDLLRPKNYLYTTVVGYKKTKDIYVHLGGNACLSLLCYFVFSNRHTARALENARDERASLEQEHLKAQLIALQQQISPHFLFNSLSTLKTMISDDTAKKYIIELAGVYRYVLSFNEKYLTRVEDELKFISSYLHILQERFQDALKVQIHVSKEDYDLLLPSLSLQLLIENAIKHNACAQKYFGKTYTSTQVIDQFFDASDVTKGYTVMGKTELGKGFRSLEKTQEKIIDLARKKGADGVIFTMEEEVYATSNSGSGTVTQKKEKNATVFSNSTTTDLK
jgi:two-component system LytT family sensor kinase